MRMTPVRLEIRSLIDYCMNAEVDFNATWLGLRNKILAYQDIYQDYANKIRERVEDFKSNLSPDVVIWLFSRPEVQLLINAWKALNELLLSLRVHAVPLADEVFTKNQALIDVGLIYQNIYGDKEMTEGIGRYELISPGGVKFEVTQDLVYAEYAKYYRYYADMKMYMPLTPRQPLPGGGYSKGDYIPGTVIPTEPPTYECNSEPKKYEHFVIPHYDPHVIRPGTEPEEYDPGMDPDHVDEYVFRSKVIMNDELASTIYENCWIKSASGTVEYEWDYQETETYSRPNWYYAYKEDSESEEYTVEMIITEERFNNLKSLYGTMYLCVAISTSKQYVLGIGYTEQYGSAETITLKISKLGEWESTLVPEQIATFKQFFTQVFTADEYRVGLRLFYYRYDIPTKTYVCVGIVNNQTELQAALDTYGTIYAGRPVLEFKDVCIENLMDLIYDVVDWQHVDIDNVKCRICGHTGMVDNPLEFRKHWLVCPNCGNYDAYNMEFPKIALLDFIRPLFKYDPNYTWYDQYIHNKTIHNELNPKKLWWGRWGHGKAAAWTSEVDDLMYKKSLRESGWDKASYGLAGNAILYLERYNLDNKIIADEILTLFTDPIQARAMFQVGNIWACRHEIVRLLCTQLMKIHQKGVIEK